MSCGYSHSQRRWCGWCCNLCPKLCRCCNLCSGCCRCPPPPIPYVCPLPCLPRLPPLGRGPPPQRIIHEQVLVPYPVPVYCGVTCQPTSRRRGPCDYYIDLDPDPAGYTPRWRHQCRRRPRPCTPCNWRDGPGCRERRQVYKAGRAMVPGYTGHVPGWRNHGAGRSFGSATRDTRCIIAKWASVCPPAIPLLPCRIYEQ